MVNIFAKHAAELGLEVPEDAPAYRMIEYPAGVALEAARKTEAVETVAPVVVLVDDPTDPEEI